MSTMFFRSGGVTVGITGLEEAIRYHLTKIENATLAAVESVVEEVSTQAAGEWYTHVRRRTGLSGRISSSVTIDVDGSQIHGQIVSADTRKGVFPGGRSVPVPLLVHESAHNRGTEKKQVSREDYFKAPKNQRGRYHPSEIDREEGITGPFIWTSPPKAHTTVTTAPTAAFYLAQRLVIGPARARVKQLPIEIRLAFARARKPRRVKHG